MLVDKLIQENGLTQSEALAVVGLGRSTYSYTPKPLKKTRPLDPLLCLAIQAIHRKSPVYGYRKVLATLKARGSLVNHKRVYRYMKHLGLLQPRKVKGQKHTQLAMVHPAVSNIYWEEDLTYVWCGNQQGYLFALIDAYDKGLPGDYFGNRCRADEAASILEQAVLKRFQVECLRIIGWFYGLIVGHNSGPRSFGRPRKSWVLS